MKTSIKLLLLSSLTAFACVGASSGTTYGVESIKCTPFYRAGINSTIKMVVNASMTNKVSLSIDIINDLYPTGANVYSKLITSPATINYSYDNNYTYLGENILQITQRIGKNTVTYKHSIETVDANLQTLNNSIYEYTSSSCFYNYSNNKWSKNREKYTFYNFEDQYIPNYYHKIDISNFYVKLNTTFDTNNLKYGNAFLAISNINGVFNSFEHDNDTAYIPLTLKKESNVLKLKFKNEMYVDPIKLIMSATKKEGYVKTEHLYLPKNEKRNENVYECVVSLEEVGLDRCQFLTFFKYKSLLNIFGDCRNSEYCIVNS